MLEFLDHDSGPESMESLPGGVQKAIRILIGTQDLSQPLSVNIWYCSIIGIWIRPSRKIQDMIYNFIVVIPQLANFAFLSANLYLNITSLRAVIENLSYSVISLTGLYAGVVFLLNVDKYYKLTVNLKLLNKKVNMTETARGAERKARLLTNGFSLYAFVGLMCYVSAPMITRKSCSSTGAIVCGLPTAGSFPYDVHRFPMFQLTYLLHAYCAVNSVLVIISPINFLGAAVVHLTSHLNRVKENIKKVCEATNETGDERYKNLCKIIKHHYQILDFAGEVSDCFSSFMLVQSTVVPLLISVLTFLLLLSTGGRITAMLDPNIMRIFLNLSGWLTELLIVSVVGQILIDESDEVADVAYNILWYKENVTFQKHILLMILRSRRAMRLSVASMGSVSLLTFSRVISSSYSYFTILYDLIIESGEEVEE